MKKSELIFGFILLPIDYLMFIMAAISAYFLRFGDTVVGLRPVIYAVSFKQFIVIILITSAFMLLIMAINGLYNFSLSRRILTELQKIFIACSTGVMLIIILVFFNRDFFSSRFIILAAWVLSIVYVFVARFIIIQLERYFLTKGYGLQKIIFIGNNHTAKILKSTLKQNKIFGYTIVEECETVTEDILEKLQKILKIKEVDEIILSQSDIPFTLKGKLMSFCNENNIVFKYAADLFEAKAANVDIRPIAGIPIVEIKKTPLDGWGKILKKVIDIIFSIIWLIGTGWLMLIVAILIKLDSKGPVLYKNERVGYKGKKFNTYKFRSMRTEYCIGAEYGDLAKNLAFEKSLIQEKSIKQGPVYKIKDDPRVTRIGQFIRKTSLDEFPQVFNVLKGEMSWIGPRPHQPREVAQYQSQQKQIFSVKPGISGLAQISGRSDLEFLEEVRLDIYYIENWSIFLDFYIMFKTPFILFKRRQAL